MLRLFLAACEPLDWFGPDAGFSRRNLRITACRVVVTVLVGVLTLVSVVGYAALTVGLRGN